MKALISKDIASMRKTLLIALTIFLAAAAYSIKEKEIMITVGFCAMLPLVLSSVTFTNDDRSNFLQLAFSIPISKKDFILSKLFFPFIFSAIGAIIIFVSLYIKNLVPIRLTIVALILTFVMCLMVSAIQFPFVLKFGAEKARILMIITYFVIFRAVMLLNRNMAEVFTSLNIHSLVTVGLALSLIGLIIIFICLKTAISIMKNKEF